MTTPPRPPDTATASSSLSPWLVLLLASTIGLCVASNYYAQPLLHRIGSEFDLSTTGAGGIATAAQLSYALGLLLIVPLGDIAERRRLIVLMMLMTAAGLALTATAGHVALVLLGTAVAGISSVVAQILLPFAALLAAPHERGKIVGTMMSGLLLGVLLARAVAGILADVAGWRAVYGVAAVSMVVMASALRLSLPRNRNPATLSYPRLLASMFRLYIEEPLFRGRSLLGMLLVCSFSMLWIPLTFLLAQPPYSYTSAAIGLFGLAGAAGALLASRVGQWVDRGHGNRSTVLGLVLLLAAWLPLAWGQHHLWGLVIGVVLLDFAIQACHVTNMSAIYHLAPEARSRLTAGIMTGNFIGAAAGSLLASWLFSVAGWPGVCMAGAGLAALALLAACLPQARIPAIPVRRAAPQQGG